MKKKALISSILTIAVCVSLIAGATFALFTDREDVNIAVTAGNVDLVATIPETDVKLYSAVADENGTMIDENGFKYRYDDRTKDGKFANGGYYTIVENTISLINVTPGDKVEFKIDIENESNVTVNWRTVVWVIDDNGLWSGLNVAIGNDTAYNGNTVYSNWAVLEPDQNPDDVPVSIALPITAGNEYEGKTCKIGYRVEAVQGNAVTKNPYNQIDRFNYEINSEEGMMLIPQILNSFTTGELGEWQHVKFTLTADMDMSKFEELSKKTREAIVPWAPISTMYVDIDGDYHTVSNLNCTTDDWGRSGFFGYAGGGSLKNITLENVTAEGTQAGIVAGRGEGLTMENVTIAGTNYVTYNKDANLEETWGGVGAVIGVASDVRAADKTVTIAKDATVTVDHDGNETEAKYNDGGLAYSQNINKMVSVEGTVTEIGNKSSLTTVSSVAELRAAINNAATDDACTTVIRVAEGTYEIDSVIVGFVDKTIVIRGSGNVTFKKIGSCTHAFNVERANVTFQKINIDGNDLDRNGIYVRYNSYVTLEECDIRNTKGLDIMIDEASEAAHGKNTTSTVKLIKTVVEDVAMCASPCSTVAATQDTYAEFIYDEESKFGYIEKQNINYKPENMRINGDNSDPVGVIFFVDGDAELAKALETIKTDSNCWNKPVFVKLAAGEYAGNYVINQYPGWTGNNYASGVPADAPYTKVKFVGDGVVEFTGKVTVNGFGNAGTYAVGAWKNMNAVTTFENITFNGVNVPLDANNARISVILTAAADNIYFNNCDFKNTTHVTLGARASNRINNVTFTGCDFENAGCLSGYPINVKVTNCTVTENRDTIKEGFLNVQNECTVTVDNVTANVRAFFLRTNGSNVKATVTNSTINVTEIGTETGLVVFRGSNEYASFDGCTLNNTNAYYKNTNAEKSVLIIDGKDSTGKWAVVDEATLANALAQGGEVKLYFDVNLTGSLVIPANSTTPITFSLLRNSATPNVVELDLNGKTITSTGLDANGKKAHVIVNEGALSIKNGTVKSTGVNGGSAIYNKGTLTIENVDVIGAPSNTAVGTASYALNTEGANSKVVIKNANISGRGAIGATEGAEVEINGGTYHTPEVAWGHAVYAVDEGTVVVINGGTFSEGYAASANNWGMYQIYAGDKAKVVVNGGDFSQEWDCANGHDLCTANDGVIEINGGSFAEDPSNQNGKNFVAGDKNVAKDPATGTHYVTTGDEFVAPGVTKDGKTYYVSTIEGLDWVRTQAANNRNVFNGCTIKFEADLDYEGATIAPIHVWSDPKPVFDGQGHTISNFVVVNTEYKGNAGLFSGTVKIVNLNVDNANVTGDYSGVLSGKMYGDIDNCKVTNSTVNGTYWQSGALVGQYNAGNVTNCTVDNCTVNGLSAVGLLVGIFNEEAGGGTRKIENCTVKNSEIVQTGSFGASYDTLFGILVGYVNTSSDYGPCTVYINNCKMENNTLRGKASDVVIGETNSNTIVVVDGTKYYVATATKLKEAVAAGATDIYLMAGEYTVEGLGGKTLTISGGKDAVIKIKDPVNDHPDSAFDSSNITFNGVTIKTNSMTYSGYTRLTATYNYCTFDGTYTLYGNGEFNNCTFNVSGDVYNIWTWGAPEATFTNCTFNSDGKAILLYGTANTKLTVNGCTFNDNGGLTDLKAAIEIGNDYGKSYELIVNNTKVNGYEINDKGICTFTTLWANKNSMGTDKLKVTVDGVEVYGPNNTKSVYIDSAEGLFAFANEVNVKNNTYSGKTVYLTADIDLKDEPWTPIGQTYATQFQGTFDGKGHTVKNLNIDSSDKTGAHYSTGLFGWLNAATVKNVNVDGATVKGNHNVGVIAGYLETAGCTVSNCNVSNATIVAKHADGDQCGDKVGVIVGHAGNAGVKVEKCSATACTVTASRDAGQIVGAAKTENVVDCTATDVTVSNSGDCTGANLNNAIIGRVL